MVIRLSAQWRAQREKRGGIKPVKTKMKKSEVQHQHTSQPTAVQQNKGVALEAPQGESLAQVDAVVESSPQVAKSAQLAAAADASLTAAAQLVGRVSERNPTH